MGKLATVLAEGPPQKVRKCEACKWLATLDPETKDEAETMFSDLGWTAKDLIGKFKPLGYVLGETATRRHRNECARG